ncbi:MAG: hypothetical protein JRJ56_04690 [Deltaproteobacteria bacterium]|nr:hypothetical protein [Deltaproteobacteria bacterium]
MVKKTLMITLLAAMLVGTVGAATSAARSRRRASGTSSAWRRNPFIPLLTPRQPEAAIRSPQAAANPEFALSPALELKAIINSGGGYKAIVGSRLVTVGDQVEGYRVAVVESNRVVLLKGKKPLELTLSPIIASRQNFVIKAAK